MNHVDTHSYCPHCCGRYGRSKRAYPTRRDAQSSANHQARTQCIELRVYECEWGWGWHLTSDVWGWS